jgi:GntR family transcriptional regulator, transcriptional repressor for pyruvate dehydrogenase complex
MFMALRTIQNRSLPDQVFEQLASEILLFRYAAGQSLPAERTLSEIFGVNRHVVREAVKRLEQIGLVKVLHGGGTKVLDFKRHAGLDLLALMAQYARGGEDVREYWRSVLEMRAAISADMIRLCALRAGPELKREIVEISAEMREAKDTKALYDLEVRFWDRVLEGSQNAVYRLAYNSMLKAASTMGEAAHQWSAYEAKRSDYRSAIASAIAAGDAEAAEAEARKLNRAVLAKLERNDSASWEATPSTSPGRKAKRASIAK